jgi:hypothetical protein
MHGDNFEIIGPITDIEPIAVGSSIRDLARLRKAYGSVAGEVERRRDDSSIEWENTQGRSALVRSAWYG